MSFALNTRKSGDVVIVDMNILAGMDRISRFMRFGLLLGLAVCLSTPTLQAQSENPTVGIPRLISLSGNLKDRNGQPLRGVVGLRLALYNSQEGGAPLWMEIQNASLDEQGHYSVLLGAFSGNGLPLDLFTSAESRWLGVLPLMTGEEERPRHPFVSVAYALKAADADTLGGRPASAFALAAPEGPVVSKISGGGGDTPIVSALQGTGNTGKLAKWLDTIGTLGDSEVTEVAGNVGIGTATPGAKLEVRAANADVGAVGNVFIASSDSAAINKGGSLTFGGAYFDTSVTELASIAGRKENATNGDFGGYLALNTRAHGGIDAERMRITSRGNVGIGTTTPGAKLEVRSANAAVGGVGNVVIASSDSAAINKGGSLTFAGAYFDTSVTELASIAGRKENATNGDFGGYLALATRAYGGIDAERMRITSTGDVGIGTTNPTARLDVSGTVKATALVGNGAGLTSLPAATDVSCASQCISTSEIADSAVSPSKMSDAARTRGITYLGGCDTCTALTTADDQQTIYYNVVGSMTIQSVTCFANAGTVTIHIKRDNGGVANVLSGPLTCNGIATTSFSISSLALNDKLDFDLFTTDGTAKRVTVAIKTIVN